MTENNKGDFATYQERDEALEKLKSLDGWKIGKKIENFGTSIFIFQGNFEELMNQIELFKKPSSLILQDVRNDDELNKVFELVTRLLHNYLSSAFTLVEHTRIFVRELYSKEEFSEFKSEYDSKIKTGFAENPLHRFMQELRNYTLHKELPIVGCTLNLNEIKADLIIDFSKLRNNFDWSSLAKEYIASKGEDEKLENTILEYFNLVLDLHDWLYKRQLEIHSKEFKEANDLRERIHNSRWTIKM